MSRFSIDWPELSLQVMITFGHFLWQACVVGVVLVVVQQLAESLRELRSFLRLRRGSVGLGETDLRGANIRYTIACVAYFSLPICVIATFAWVHQSRGPIVLVASDPVESPASPIVSASEAIPPMANTGFPVLPPPVAPMNAEVPVTEPIEPQTLVEEPQTSSVQRIQAFAPCLLLAYMVGVCFMLARFLLSIIGSSRLRQTIQPTTDVKLHRTIAEQCARVGLRRIPVVALCQRVSVPVVVGIVKPMILLPPALLCGLDPNQIAAILSHELAHIRRYDLVVNFLQRIVEALLFFHPVTWWISRRVSIERENCCDDVAADCMGRLPYAGALLQMAELCIGNDHRRKAALATLSASGNNSTDLGYRIRRLIGAEETTRVGFTRRSISIGMAMVSLLTISLVAWGQSQQSAKDEKPKGDAMAEVFTPEPLWQTKLAADDIAPETLRLSPVVVAGNRVLSIEKDFALRTGKEVESTFVRLPRKNVFEMTLDPVFRRTSSDRDFLVEVSVHGMGKVDGVLNYGSISSCDIRVLRATDGGQVGTTIHLSHFFDGITSDVDVENGGDFLVIGVGNEVQVYRTTTGQVETTMPVKTKRVDAVAISPDREWLVVSDQNDLHFWRWRDQAPVNTIHAGRKIDSLVFTPDGQYLAEGPDTREDIQIRDMRTLEIIASLKDEVGSPLMVSSMDITPNGRYLVAHNEVSVDPEKLAIPHRIHVWDLQSRGKPVFQIATGEWVRKVAFSDDGRMIVGEFSGAAHGALLAAWQLPNEILQKPNDSPIDAKDRLGDGIQWSRFGDENGLLSGARLMLPKDGLKPGEPLVVEYRLANVSKGTKTLKCYLNKGMQFASLGHGNRISGFGLDREREPETLTIEPGEVFIDTKHLVSIDTTGLEPGEYHAALGSAFFYPDSVEPNTTHELPHRGSIPFTIVGESAVKVFELPKSDIHWGKPIAGLQVGARFAGDPTAYAIGATIEADLFVANVTDQPIECSVVLPHPRDGWLFNVEDSNGSTIMLERPMRFSSPFPQEYVQLKLAPGEVTVLIQDQDKKDGTPSRPRPKFELADKETEEQGWSDYTIKGRLVTLGGTYSAIFDIVIMRPEIPALRLELDSGNVPFTVLKPSENATAVDQVMMRTADDKPGAMVAENRANGQNTGALKGRLTLDGVVPLLPKLRVRTPASPLLSKRASDEEHKKFETSLVEIDDESIQVDVDQGVANAFVYLAKAPSNWQPTQEDLEPFTLTMQDDSFAPRAAIVRTGQDLRLNNSGVDADNFAFEPVKNDGQNRAVEAGSEITLKHPFTITERTPVQAKSHIHPWKAAFLLPLDHPFAAITDKQGRFSIEGLPPGEHSFLIWHERTGWLEKSFVVNIEAGQTTEVNRSYSVDRFRLAANLNPSNDTPIDILWGESVDGMRLGIRRSEFARRRSPLRHGEHIDYEVWIKNETDEIVQIARDPRDVHSPRLMDDQSINVIGWSTGMSFMIPPLELAKAELILSPGQAAHRFPMPNHSTSIRPPGSPRGRYGSEPLHLDPGKYPVYAQFGELKSGVEKVEIITAARLQIRKASRVTEKKREYAAEDPSEAILAWQSGDGEKREAMVNWDHGVLVDERDLASVEIVPVEGQPDQNSILLHLRPESATWLARQIKMYSLWDDPDLVAILLDGKPLMALRLDASKPVGEIRIDGKLTQVAASSLLLTLQSLISKPIESKTTASNNNTQSSEEKQDSNKQSFKLIDGETGKPLQGLKCRAIVAKMNASPRYQECTTDEHGVVEVVVAKDESAGIAEVPSGWFSNGFGSVFVVQMPESEQRPQQNAEKKNEEPKLLKLWRGTEVDGRLLWPDKTPAAGVTLTAGVYINHQSWKEKLGINLGWHSWDHGDWPNWSRTIVTDDDGNFRATVPPKDARIWVRIGTTHLGFGAQINVGENEAITQRLAKCAPLKIQYGGSSRSNMLIVHDITENDDMVLHAGDLQLETGVIVRGRVVDAEGNGLSNVYLTTTGLHGPHSGRSATSGEDGDCWCYDILYQCIRCIPVGSGYADANQSRLASYGVFPSLHHFAAYLRCTAELRNWIVPPTLDHQ